MPSYKYTAVDEAGAQSTGVVDAPSAPGAQNELVARGLRVTKLREKKGLLHYEITRKKIKPDDVMNFSRQLGAFLHAGVPILDSLAALSEDCDSPVLKQAIIDISDSLRGGSGFADALAQHQELFPSYYIGILRSAELTGSLDLVLEQLAVYIERDQATKRSIRSALTYPIVVVMMAIVTVVVLVAFVLPRFESFFADFHAKLPLATRLMLSISRFFQSTWFILLVVAVVIALFCVWYFRTPKGRVNRDRLMLWAPLVGGIVKDGVIERFCRTLGTMLRAGVAIPDAMTSASDATNNRVYQLALVGAREEMMQGEGIAAPLHETGLFPTAASQMIKVGEQSGSLDRQLDVAADYFEGELTQKLKKLTSLIEPAIIVTVGLMVGFVAIALVSAMYGIFNQVKIK